MKTTQFLAMAAVLSIALATPALARDGKPPRHRDWVHRSVAVDRTAVAATDAFDDFIRNGNQPYFDGTDGGVGYMGYYRRGSGPAPVLVTGAIGCMPGTRFNGFDGRRHVCQ
ncbi:MAG: hypothetical protein ABW213_05260 [Tardiphaga sp.]